MTAQEKAKAGLWLIEEAILQLLREKGRMQPPEVADALSLRSDLSESKGPRGICYSIMQKMANDGLLIKAADQWHPRYSIGARSTPN
jgi:hypothetical protein